MALVLTPSSARTIIECSEGAPGLGNAGAGHTKARHVSISKAALALRMEAPDPQGRNHGKSFWRSAFLDIQSCADLLVRTVEELAAEDFVRDFENVSDGQEFSRVPIHLDRFECRDMRGRAQAWHVGIAMQKYRARPGGLHLITFYPTIPLPENW